mmetsp:Transcript_36121/g.94345  ORF Transcript_36121/g.94345 Transcript_36121/m.94345 type:complete len:218 (-) Transcript_36121:411-1064(-)
MAVSTLRMARAAANSCRRLASSDRSCAIGGGGTLPQQPPASPPSGGPASSASGCAAPHSSTDMASSLEASSARASASLASRSSSFVMARRLSASEDIRSIAPGTAGVQMNMRSSLSPVSMSTLSASSAITSAWLPILSTWAAYASFSSSNSFSQFDSLAVFIFIIALRTPMVARSSRRLVSSSSLRVFALSPSALIRAALSASFSFRFAITPFSSSE